MTIIFLSTLIKFNQNIIEEIKEKAALLRNPKPVEVATAFEEFNDYDDETIEEIEEAILSGDIAKAKVVAEEHVAHLKEFIIKHGENLFQDTKKDEIN